jgi:hypothetical protein
MAFTTPKTWAGTEVLTSADMNTYVRDNIDYLFDSCPTSTGWMNHGTLVAQSNQRIESGTHYLGLTTATYGSDTVSFNAAFGTAPRVFVTENNLGLAGHGRAVGTGSFKIYGIVCGAGTASGSAYLSWMAIGV